MSFCIEKFNYVQDWDKLVAFFKTVYSPGHISTNQKYFEWQFVHHGFINLVVKKDKEIIGHLGMVNPSFLIGGLPRRVGFLTCLMLLPTLRNHGMGVFLNREIEREMDVLLGTGFNQDGLKLVRALNWTEAGNLHRWIFNQPATKKASTAVPVTHFDEGWDNSWAQIKARFPATTNRTSKYLNWRFADHAMTKYQIFGIKSGALYNGYIVLRLEAGEMKGLRIVDFVAKDAVAEKELLAAAFNYAAEIQVDFIDFFCSSKIYDQSFTDIGFSGPESAVALETPVFILPIDNFRKYINWAYKIINPELKDLKQEYFFIVKADGDKDRAQV